MDAGKQFAQYLMLGKITSVNQSSQNTFVLPSKEEFISVMDTWFTTLCSCNQIDGLKECTRTATDIFIDWKRDILYFTAKLLLNSHLCEDAIDFFRMALVCNNGDSYDPSDLDIEEDIEQAVNRCIPRWHFRMINDISRNRGFYHAVKKALDDGYSNVVDIGAGSGILRFILLSLVMLLKNIINRHIQNCLFDIW